MALLVAFKVTSHTAVATDSVTMPLGIVRVTHALLGLRVRIKCLAKSTVDNLKRCAQRCVVDMVTVTQQLGSAHAQKATTDSIVLQICVPNPVLVMANVTGLLVPVNATNCFMGWTVQRSNVQSSAWHLGVCVIQTQEPVCVLKALQETTAQQLNARITVMDTVRAIHILESAYVRQTSLEKIAPAESAQIHVLVEPVVTVRQMEAAGVLQNMKATIVCRPNVQCLASLSALLTFRKEPVIDLQVNVYVKADFMVMHAPRSFVRTVVMGMEPAGMETEHAPVRQGIQDKIVAR